MCTNKTKVINKYTKQELYVKCGCCESCRQEKADLRTSRILNNCPAGYTVLFVHLTYMDEHVPYFYMEDLHVSDGVSRVCVNGKYYVKFNQIPIYRKYDAYRYYNPHSKQFEIKRKFVDEELATYFYRYCSDEDLSKLYDIGDGLCAVLFYQDIQDFFKRLRNNYERKTYYRDVIGTNDRIHYFVAGEYGETNSRCHWHILLYVPEFERQLLYKWRELICESWLFADYWLTYNKGVDFAIAGASYASSYVNCSADISSFLQRDDFKPCWHYSQGFGCVNEDFDFNSLLSRIEKKDLSYVKQVNGKNGSCRVVTTTIPTYFTNRFFPRFKGMCFLDYAEVYDIISVPSRLVYYRKKMNLSDDDFNQLYMNLIRMNVRFMHAFLNDGMYINLPREPTKLLDIYNSYPDCGFECAFWYVSFLQAKNATRFRLWYRSMVDDSDLVQAYDNIKEFKEKHVQEYLVFKYNLLNYTNCDSFVTDCNDFKINCFKSLRSSERFRKKIKQRKITQLCQNL